MRSERITFQEKTATRSASGSSEYSWANLSDTPTMWAEAMPRTSNEDFSSDQEGGFQRYIFKVLWRDDLSEKMRVSWNGKYWNIRSVTPIHKGDRHKETEIIAEWREGYYQ